MIRHLLARLRSPVRPASPAEEQLRLVNEHGQPNINDLWQATKDIEALKLDVKALTYEMARMMESKLQGVPIVPAHRISLESKPVTQSDIESRWFRGWCAELLERPRFHRSLWEAAFVLQALFEGGAVEPDARVLNLGGGSEAVMSYLAAKGVRQTVLGVDRLHSRDALVDQTRFNDAVTRSPVGLDQLPGGLEGFDGCWSMGAAGRMVSIRKGLDLVLAGMEALKPGGVAVHALDFNFADDQRTIDNWQAVLFQRRHIEDLAQALQARGHEVKRLDFHVGHTVMDRIVDIPPYDLDRTKAFDRLWRDGWQGAHMKVNIDGFAVTSFGLICRKGAG
jgi:hypothetical protein